jgi:hypothetical protein
MSRYFRCTTTFVLLPLTLSLLNAQQTPKPGARKAQVAGTVQASRAVLAPVQSIDANMAAPKPSPQDEESDETTVPTQNLATSLSPTPARKLVGAERAGPSAVLAVSQLPHGQTFDIAEAVVRDASRRTPELTTKWANGANKNGGGDPQIAAGTWAIAVLTWGTLAFYDKAGRLLPSTDGFANPTDMLTLFANTLTALDHNIKLAPQAQGDPKYLFANGSVGDARVIFDNFRKRWVVLATAKTTKGVDDSPLKHSQRRNQFLLAVSKDEDPAKGFRTFPFAATPDDGACAATTDDAPCPGTHFTPGNAADYPSIGVSKKHYIMTDHVNHYSVENGDNKALYGYMVIVNADDAASSNHAVQGYAFWKWDLGNGDHAPGVTMPVVMHNDLPGVGSGTGFIATTLKDRFILTTVGPADPPQLGAIWWDVPDMHHAPGWKQKGSNRLVTYGNVGNQPITATLQGLTLTAAFDDCRIWFDSQDDCSPSVHLITVRLPLFPLAALLDKDRVFGGRNQLDDASNDVVAYGLPGIAGNKQGDIAVVYQRTSPKLYIETRFSAWMHNEPDLRPSRELEKGKAPIPANISDCPQSDSCKAIHSDTAGVSLDPFDDTAIWMAHAFADSDSSMRLAVGKVFGSQHPDLALLSATLMSPTTVKAGETVSVNCKLHNGGDGSALESQVELLLVPTERRPTTSLGQTAVGNLQPDDTVLPNASGKIPASQPKGDYTVKVRAKLKPGVDQYTETNDVLTVATLHVN